jgi:hypothetical protein
MGNNLEKKIQVTLSNGVVLPLNLADTLEFFNLFLEKYLKPHYLQKNDWNATLKDCITEIDRISIIHGLSRNEIIQNLLNIIDDHLPLDISNLTGVDKVEILFLNLDDVVGEIRKAVIEEPTQEMLRFRVSKIVEGLNLFETAELLIYYAKKIQ